MFVNFISENLQAIGIIKENPVCPVESVMLNLRAKGLKKQSRKNLFRVLSIGFIIGLFTIIMMMPISILKRLPSLLLSLLVGLTLFYHFNLVKEEALIYALIIYLALNGVAIFGKLLLLIFDLVDILTYGSLTRLWLFSYFLRINEHKEFRVSSLVTHIFVSRQLLLTDNLCREGDNFFNQYQSIAYDDDAKKELVANYWKNIDGYN
jgi:hypothetical protein